MKKILVIGGTQFIGRVLTEKLLRSGNAAISLFNRGKTGAGLFPELQRIHGDRYTGDIDQLKGKTWDLVYDFSCYYPKNFVNLLQLLEGHTGAYVHISTISVYDLEGNGGKIITENSPCYTYGAAEQADPSKAHYGQNKKECERLLLTETALPKTIFRPSLVYGRYDYTDRFYFWLYRMKKNLPLLLPGGGKDLITLTYVQDLVNVLTVPNATAEGTIYNATTHAPLPLYDLVMRMKKAMASQSRMYQLTADETINAGIRPGTDLPLWYNTPLEISNARLQADHDVKLTDLDQSIGETIAYYEDLGWPEPKAGNLPVDIFAHAAIAEIA